MDVVENTDLPNLIHRGKVRDSYSLDEKLFLMIATDRISAYDVIIPTPIPGKGSVLTNLSAFWFKKTEGIVPNHLVAFGMNGKGLLPDALAKELSGLPAPVLDRSMVAKKAQRIDVECVVRGYITGSAWAEYTKTGTVHGDVIEKGLLEGDKFPEPIFTPTTKAEVGHDEAMSLRDLDNQLGKDLAKELAEISMNLYLFAHEYGLKRGIIIADTKVEFGTINGEVILIDELFTPDSSRFWDAEKYKPGRSQPNFDKQYVRDWLTDQGWNREPPAPELPLDVVERTQERYMEARKRLMGG